MRTLLALVAGYVLGAKAGSKDLDQLARSLKALAGTDEFAEVVAAGRSHLAGVLREVAAAVDGDPATADGSDLVAKVRHLVGRN